MHTSEERAIAIVGVGAILPDAPSAADFWTNIVSKKYSITEVPPERWSAADYYDPDPSVPDKTYTTLGGWVRGFEFDWRRFRMPPKMAAAMDEGQQWAVTIAAEALADYGFPERPLNTENTAVILGTAMGGELHYTTHERIAFPEYANALKATAHFLQLSPAAQEQILSQWHDQIAATYPPITEDSMPGELPNIVSGRVANILNLRGANFITDAACASSFAAINAAIELLVEHQADAVLTGGVDHNMGISSFVKFCKIGALSATGSRPFGAGADGFIMGEGSAAFLLKRLVDAERSGDTIYAVIRGIGGASDGKGKGITAPNPIGQRLAVARAWENADLDPASATLVEAHGTSTRVGDVVEVESLSEIFGAAAPGSIGLGSAKSNIGHLKAGAGAAGLLKAVMALHHKILPPTLNAQKPNPNIDFQQTPFYLLHDVREWAPHYGTPRRCGVSAYGFGGTNFHLVLEEHLPGALTKATRVRTAAKPRAPDPSPANGKAPQNHRPAPVRGILALGASTPSELQHGLDAALKRVETGWAPPKSVLPQRSVIAAPERLIVDFADQPQLLDRLQKARRIMGHDNEAAWKAIEAQGVFRGRGQPPGKTAFLFPGQGSQYVNMGRELAEISPVVAAVFAEADAIMEPILGRPLTDYIFVDPDDPQAMMQAQFGLMQTEITQPAMLTLDIAVMKLLAEYGFKPDMVMGHSLGEYAALIAADAMPFADALEATAARGSEMSKVSWDDNGKMAAIIAPYDVVMQTLAEVDGYVIPANINSHSQCVIGGASKAVEAACKRFEEEGYRAIQIPVSHAFHTEIVAPASGPLREVLDRLHIYQPRLPVVANLTGEFYPQTPEEIKACLQQQVASTVQWVKGLETLYNAGVRTFVEAGPKRALRGFARDVFCDKDDVVALMTLHPKTGELPAFNQALCALYAAGYAGENDSIPAASPITSRADGDQPETTPQRHEPATEDSLPSLAALSSMITTAVQQALSEHGLSAKPSRQAYDRNRQPAGSVVISGTGLGLPGAEKAIMDPDNAQRILRGEQFVDLIPERFRRRMVDKRITRLVKAADGNGRLVTISDPAEVIKLAGRPGAFDLAEEYGVPQELVDALDITAALAIAAGIDALREAGIPLSQTYRRTTTGKFLPDRWLLPEPLRDETGVIFASAFPGGDQFAAEMERYHRWQSRLAMLETLEDLRQQATEEHTLAELNRRLGLLRADLEQNPYTFDRRFLFRILSMGHSQFAQFIGARGPNTQVNAACASSTQAVALAEDWIRSGRCRRVVVIGGDAVTSDQLMEWVGAGFLAVGAATTKDRLDEAALPFDRRRHGTIIGMGACALVVESEDALQERGMRGIVELLSSETANSAFHGTRLDVEHITQIMNNLLTTAERRFGLHRQAIAANTVFMSHETFTPARGGSAAAEIEALRVNFGDAASSIIIANTKGFTGHPMGVGVEDVIAVKILEHGLVPPVPNFKEVDPELGLLNLSRGGRYPVQYALHLAAGFGSQIAMTLVRRIPGSLDRLDNRPLYNRWLAGISGYHRAETEVVQRTLRVKAQGAPPNTPAPSGWQVGSGPSQRVRVTDGQPAPPPPAALQPAPQPVRATYEPPPEQTEEGAETIDKGRASPPPSLPEQLPLLAQADTQEQGNEVAAKILALVAEQTGYPQDMLDLDLDLEADLGIDTVKQAETFAAIQEEFAIEARDDLTLRDYNTLEKVIAFVYEMRPDLAFWSPAAAPVQTEEEPLPAERPALVAAPPEATTDVDPVTSAIIALVSEQTGYPEDMLDLDLDLEADLGIDTVKQAETFAAIQEQFDIPARDDLSLREYNTLEKVIAFVKEMRPELTPQPAPQPTLPATAAPAEEDSQEADLEAADPVAAAIIALVSEQTGYPEDMLDLDLDLEADLGIDTVKQAETFLAIRETYGIPAREDLSLRDYDTLEKVIAFVYEMRPDLKRGGGPAFNPAITDPPLQMPVAHSETRYRLEDADQMPRRVPVPAMRPPLSLCKTTAVTLGEKSRIVLMPDQGGVAKALSSRLQKLGVDVLQLDPQSSAAELVEQVVGWREEGDIQGVYWLPALDVEAPLPKLSRQAFRQEAGLRVKKLYHTMRALYEEIERPGTFLVAATRLGGLFGFGAAGATAPLGGGVAGFSKAYNIEQRLRSGGKGPLVKVVDFAESRKTAALADHLVAETLHDPGVVEVGYCGENRYSITLLEQPAATGQLGLDLNQQTIFLVTGAAGGITSEIVADLAAASQGTFYLLDLVDLPAGDDRDILLFRSGLDNLRRKLIADARNEGQRPTPVEIDRQIAAIERREAALRAVEAVQQAGGQANYRAIDLLDRQGIQRIVDGIRREHGRIDILIHAAGLLFDRILPAKNSQQFDLVFDVKTEGFFNLLHAAGDLPIAATVCFSSVAARFGNNGQTDYSAANELLGKIISSMRRWRPETRGLVIDWTAWGDIGMAARGSVPTVMKAMGIDMLPPAAGVPTVRRELVSSDFKGEILVAGALGEMTAEMDQSGGLDLQKARRWLLDMKAKFPLVGELTAAELYGGLQAQTILDPNRQPFLFDHAPDEDTPWLPGVMATEALVELATLFAPGYAVAAVEDEEMLGAFKFFRNQPRTLYLSGVARPAANGELLVHAALRSHTEPAREGLPVRIQEHFRARIRLAPAAKAQPHKEFTPPETGAMPATATRIYEAFFHGPSYQVIERIGIAGGRTTALMAHDLPPELDRGESQLQMAPRLVELCFQAAAHWHREVKQDTAFPLGFGRLTVFREQGDKRLYALVQAKEDGRLFDADVVDEEGAVYVELRDYQTVARPGAFNAEAD